MFYYSSNYYWDDGNGLKVKEMNEYKDFKMCRQVS